MLNSYIYGNYDGDAWNIMRAMSTPPIASQCSAINAQVVSLKSGGYWTKLDMLQWYGAPSSPDALLDWRYLNRTVTANNSPTFTAQRGFTGNGSNAYIDTGYNASTFGGVYVQDSAHIGLWLLAKTATSAIDLGQTGSGSVAYLNPRNASDQIRSRIDDGTDFLPANADGTGYYCATRRSSTDRELYKDGASVVTTVTTSTGVPSTNFCCLRNNSAYSASQVLMCCAGSGLSDADVAAIYAIFNTYKTFLLTL